MDFLNAIGRKLQTAIGNIKGNVSALVNPQTRGTWLQGLTPQLPQTIQKPISNLQQNVKIVSNPQTAQTWSQGFSDSPTGTAAKYFTNRYIAPVAQLPRNVSQVFSPKSTLLERGTGALGALGGVMTLIPDPIQDVAMPIYDTLKGYSASAKRGGNLKQNLESATKALTLEKPVGLGSATTIDPLKEQILNIGELPLMIGLTHKVNKKLTGGWSKDQIEIVRKGFSPEVRDLVGRFGQMAEENPTGINRKNLGLFGEYIHSLADTVFGKESANLTNKQLKNAFDNIMQVADKGRGIREPFTIGLGTQNTRKVLEENQPIKPPVEGGVKEGGVPQIQPFQKDLERFTALIKQNDKYGQGVPAIGKLPSSQAVADQMGITHEELMSQVLGRAGKPVPQTLSTPSEVIPPTTKRLPPTPSEVFTSPDIPRDFQPAGGGPTAFKAAKNPNLVWNSELNRFVDTSIPPEAGPKVDPFIQSLENSGVRPQKQYPATTVPTDKATGYQQTVKGGGFTGKVDPVYKQEFADWVNNRRATKVEGLLKQKEFSDLNSKGLNGILEFQSGDKTGRLADVQKYFDEKYNVIKDTGIDVNYKKNYLPQLWANTAEEVAQKLGRKLSTHPSFTMQSLIKDYQEGIQAGLTPKFKTIGELVGWYERVANKTIADVSFFRKIAKDGLIMPSSKAPYGWKILDPTSFPKISTNIPGEGRYTGNYSAPFGFADLVNGYLKTPEMGGKFEQGLAAVANFASEAKNRLLSFGLINPVGGVISKLKGGSFAEGAGTGLNFHGFNILARSYLEGGPVGALKTAWYMVRPSSAERFVNTNLSIAPDAIKSGLSIGTSERPSVLETERFLSKFGNKWNELFEKPLFDKVIVAKKLEGWTRVWKDYAKSMPEKQAKTEAAKFINNIYGGINWEQMGRDRNLQNFFRTVALTPDWLESNLKLGGNIIKSAFDIKNPTGKAYRRALTNLIAGYAGLNVINKMSSGHYMWQNEPGHAFEIDAGTTADGQKRYIRPFGTAVDFARIPIDIALGLLKGDPSPAFKAVRNRLSVLITPAIDLLSNSNWSGQTIYGKTKYGKPMTGLQSAMGVGGTLATAAGLPTFLQQAGQYATGQQGAEQALLQGFELPVRYSNYKMNELSAEKSKTESANLIEKNTAGEIFKQLENIQSPEERNNFVESLIDKKQITEKQYNYLVDMWEAKKLNLTPYETQLKLSPIETRANIILKEVSKLPLNEQREYLAILYDKKIVTDNVYEEMVKLGYVLPPK